MACTGFLHPFSLSAGAKNRGWEWSLCSVDRIDSTFTALASTHLDETWYNFTEAWVLASSLIFGTWKTTDWQINTLLFGAMNYRN